MKVLFPVSLAGLLALSTLPAMAATNSQVDRVEVAFVLDTTGSMIDLIDGAKRKIWSIANTIVDTHPDADISMALIGYRDRGDEYVVKTHNMTSDLQTLYGNLMRFNADGGGDTPESVNEALDTAVRAVQWSKGQDVKRIIFLVGDAPPHMDYDDDRPYPETLREARQRGIIVNAVQAGSDYDTTEVWQEIAQLGGGRFIPIPQDGGDVVVIVSPYDEEILRLQGELDRTIVPYGSAPMQEAIEKKIGERASASTDVRVENSKYYSKKTKRKEVVTGGGDLVADLENNDIKLENVAEDDLPSVLRKMSAAERKAWIQKKRDDRSALTLKMQELIAKRDAYVAAERAKVRTAEKADSFDKAVEETLKVQLQ